MAILLTTQPHAEDGSKPFIHVVPHMEQCNEIMRQIAQTDTSVWFADLDYLMTGKEEDQFKDAGHLTELGKQRKAALLGEVILSHLRETKKAE